MRTVIFKVSGATLAGVLKTSKFALQGQPNLASGDVILLAQTLKSLRPGDKQIRHRMVFVRSYLDRQNESDRIWGRHWQYIIEGANLQELRRPFNIHENQVTNKNYGPGGTIVYLHEADEASLVAKGLLQTY